MRIKCIVTYDGTNFFGFQKQPNKRSVQQVIEKAFLVMTGDKVLIHASGRTDRGVHAKGQVFHFDTDRDIPVDGWKRGLNSLLPQDVHILSAEVVDDDFHSRFSVKSKEYRYYIKMGEYDPLLNNYASYCNKLDVSSIASAITEFVGTHDYKGFANCPDIEDTVRTIFSATIKQNGDCLELIFVGDGFMRYMVRRMVGTLIEIGMGRYQKEQIAKVFLEPERYLSGKTAKPNGLYLYHVCYGDDKE